MKQTFSAQELQRWIAATRAEIAAGPDDFTDPNRSWTTAQVVDAWATSAANVLDGLEKFMTESRPQ